MLERALRGGAAAGPAGAQIAELRRCLIALSITTDDAHYWRVGAGLARTARARLGPALYRELAHVDGSRRAADGQALTRATEQYGATPEAERVYRADEAIRYLVQYVVVSIAIGARTQDARALRSLPALLEPFAALIAGDRRDVAERGRDLRVELRVPGPTARASAGSSVYERLGKVTGAELQAASSTSATRSPTASGWSKRARPRRRPRAGPSCSTRTRCRRSTRCTCARSLRLQQGDVARRRACRKQAELLAAAGERRARCSRARHGRARPPTRSRRISPA